MKNSYYEQYATVREDSAALFTAKLNEEIYRLRHHRPTVVLSESDPLCAYVKYTINEQEPETVAEASEVQGIKFRCEQCPYFTPTLKQDETIDKRCKYGDCPHAELGRTLKDSPACDLLFNALEECKCRIVFDD